MAAPTMLAHALAWAARGFPVFPLVPGGKDPALKGWQSMATTDPARITTLWNREYNIGVLARDLIIVDVDDKNGHTGSEDWELFGFPSDTLTVLTPTGGRHLYYRGAASGQPDLTPNINIRAAGMGYVVGPGSVINDRPYTLLADLPLLDAPPELVEHCQRRRPERSAFDGELDTDEAVARAVEFLTNRKPAVEGQNGDLWTVVTANNVIDFGVSPEMCLELMAEHWNDRCSPPWELEGPDSLQTKVDSAWRTRTLPPGNMAPEEEFRAVSVPPPEHKPRLRPKFLWLGDKSLDLSQQWLIYNRFPRVGTAAIVGPSNSGKTFLALDLGACLGSGHPWLGKESEERVGTILLTAEGIGGLPARMAGYEEEGPVVATTVKLIKDDPKALTETLEEAALELRRKGVRTGVIIIDTLTASGLLDNENDNSEIGRALNYLEQMAVAFQCLVLVTHHPPKTGTGMRGGYALHAGFDTIVEIFHDPRKRERYVECTKGRDAPIGAWGSFVLEPFIVQPDRSGKGRDITTQRVIYGTEQRQVSVERAPSRDRQEKFFGSFDDARTKLKLWSKEEPVPLEELKFRYLELVRGWKGSPEQSFMDLLRWAKNNDRVIISDSSGVPMIVEA